jgi:Ecdysteroid kinase-like family
MSEIPSPAESVVSRLLPRRLDQVDAAWLSDELGRRYPGIVIQEMTELECKNSHTTKLRVALRYNSVGVAAGLPETVCLKANWSGMRTGEICEREARFYDMVAAAPSLAAQVPGSVYSSWDGDGKGNGLVVMEDLALAPGRFGASTDHLGVDGVAAGLESLAKVHGSLWGSEVLDRPWMPRSFATVNDTEQVAQYWHYMMFNLADPAYTSSVPAWVYERPELMHWLLDELCAYEQEVPAPYSVVHGDAHQGNTFRRGADTDPTSWVWLDWQLVRRGAPWRDVSYFLVGSLSVDERRASERDLVDHYREVLLATDAQQVPSADQAWQHYLRYPAYGSQAWLGNINQWGQSNGAEIVKRHFAALEDHEVVGLLTNGKTPRRPFVPGEGSYRLPPGLTHSS